MLLRRALLQDCAKIHAMQVEAFQGLLDLYEDYETNPGAEKLRRIEQKMLQNHTDYYFIQVDDTDIGVIRVVRIQEDICRISPIFILPAYQGNGYAQQAIALVEKSYPKVVVWQLDTIKQEKKLRHLYQKMGYRKTGNEHYINEKMTIVDYEKVKIPK